MKVKEVMSKNLIWVSPETTALEAAVKMRDEIVSCLPVVKDGKLVGITTDRLLALTVVADGLDPTEVKVKEFMSENMVSVLPDMKLAKAVKLLEELEIRYLPAVDRDNKLIGILSISDVASFVEIFVESILIELGARVRRRKKSKN